MEHKVGDLVYNNVYDKLGYISEYTYDLNSQGERTRYYKVLWLGTANWEFEYNEDSINAFKRTLRRKEM